MDISQSQFYTVTVTGAGSQNFGINAIDSTNGSSNTLTNFLGAPYYVKYQNNTTGAGSNTVVTLGTNIRELSAGAGAQSLTFMTQSTITCMYVCDGTSLLEVSRTLNAPS